jgi:hypothetical protein
MKSEERLVSPSIHSGCPGPSSEATIVRDSTDTTEMTRELRSSRHHLEGRRCIPYVIHDAKGYGFITQEAGDDVFVHF